MGTNPKHRAIVHFQKSTDFRVPHRKFSMQLCALETPIKGPNHRNFATIDSNDRQARLR